MSFHPALRDAEQQGELRLAERQVLASPKERVGEQRRPVGSRRPHREPSPSHTRGPDTATARVGTTDRSRPPSPSSSSPSPASRLGPLIRRGRARRRRRTGSTSSGWWSWQRPCSGTCALNCLAPASSQGARQTIGEMGRSRSLALRNPPVVLCREQPRSSPLTAHSPRRTHEGLAGGTAGGLQLARRAGRRARRGDRSSFCSP